MKLKLIVANKWKIISKHRISNTGSSLRKAKVLFVHYNPKSFPLFEELLDKLSKENPKKFEEVINVGVSIEKFAKDEDIENLTMLIDANTKNLNYLSYFVKEAFLTALNFK